MTNHVRTHPTISMFGMKSARRSILWPSSDRRYQVGAKPRDATAFTARLCLSTAPADRLAAVGVRRYLNALCANGTIGRRPNVEVIFYTRVEESGSFSPFYLPISEVPPTDIPVITSKPPAITPFFAIAMPSTEYLLSGTVAVQATASVGAGEYRVIEFGSVGEATNVRVVERRGA